MKPSVPTFTLLAIAGSLFASSALAQPASFAACAACHNTTGAPGGLGPSLKGVVGRKAGTAAGFTFSPAMKRSGLTWDDKTLDSFLADPQKAVPGNTMPFPGVPDAKQRTEIIDYLNTVK